MTIVTNKDGISHRFLSALLLFLFVSAIEAFFVGIPCQRRQCWTTTTTTSRLLVGDISAADPPIDNDKEQQQEFDVDQLTSINEINDLSRDIEGPEFRLLSTDKDDKTSNTDNREESETLVVVVSSLDEAKDRLWAFIEDAAEEDVNKMCMGQITVLMEELGGEDFEDGTTLMEARDQVWERAITVFDE